MKYYNYPYPDEGECVWPIDEFIAEVEDNDSLIIEEQKRDYGCEFMWCAEYGEYVLRGDNECGLLCEQYNPCNGKNGRCSKLKNTFTGSRKMIKIICFNGEITITKLKES